MPEFGDGSVFCGADRLVQLGQFLSHVLKSLGVIWIAGVILDEGFHHDDLLVPAVAGFFQVAGIFEDVRQVVVRRSALKTVGTLFGVLADELLNQFDGGTKEPFGFRVMAGRSLVVGHMVLEPAQRVPVIGVLWVIEHKLLLPRQCVAEQRRRFRHPVCVPQKSGQGTRKQV